VSAAAAPVTTAVLARRDIDRAEWVLWACLPAWTPLAADRGVGVAGRLPAPLQWALAIAAGAAGMRLPQLGAAACGTHIGNGIVHVAVSADQRPYTPGLATSLAFLLPLGLGGLGSIARHPQGGTRQAAVGAAVGLATGLASFVGLRLRAARGR